MKDPEAAEECIHENVILRRIAPTAIEDTGGYFVALTDEDMDFLPRLLEGCHKVGIPVEEVSGEEARREEPALSSQVRYALAVPDGSVDSWILCSGNVASAKEHGARYFLYTPVVEFIRQGDRVVGIRAVDKMSGEEYIVHAEYVVNAAGVWAGQVAALAGVYIHMVPNKGTMVVLDGRPVRRAINRCRYPSDGDIIVPVGTTIVLGTTSVNIEDPDTARVEEWEIDKLLDEAAQMVPAVDDLGMQRAFVGVRPLYQPPQEEGEEEGREISRGFYVLDHEVLDGVGGFISIVGGKLTTYRLMAEKTVDLVCAKLGVDEPCRTHLEPLPTAEG